MLSVANETLHSNAITTDDGKTIWTDKADTMYMQISGSPTSFTVVFEETMDGTNWSTSECYKRGDVTKTLMASTTTTGIYEFDIIGIKAMRARISAIVAGTGSLTVIAEGYET